MPTISYFYVSAIRMYLNDHFPPHLHAEYGESEACIAIETGRSIEGYLPKAVERLVAEWVSLNNAALVENWRLARLGLPLNKIGGLDAEQGR